MVCDVWHTGFQQGIGNPLQPLFSAFEYNPTTPLCTNLPLSQKENSKKTPSRIPDRPDQRGFHLWPVGMAFLSVWAVWVVQRKMGMEKPIWEKIPEINWDLYSEEFERLILHSKRFMCILAGIPQYSLLPFWIIAIYFNFLIISFNPFFDMHLPCCSLRVSGLPFCITFCRVLFHQSRVLACREVLAGKLQTKASRTHAWRKGSVWPSHYYFISSSAKHIKQQFTGVRPVIFQIRHERNTGLACTRLCGTIFY